MGLSCLSKKRMRSTALIMRGLTTYLIEAKKRILKIIWLSLKEGMPKKCKWDLSVRFIISLKEGISGKVHKKSDFMKYNLSSKQPIPIPLYMVKGHRI